MAFDNRRILRLFIAEICFHTDFSIGDSDLCIFRCVKRAPTGAVTVFMMAPECRSGVFDDIKSNIR
jgi:hypothetical protein